MEKGYGFPVTRKRQQLFLPPAWLLPAVLAGLLLAAGITRAWSQNSESSLSGSETTSPVWGSLSGALRKELNALRMELIEARNDLIAASADLTQSKALSTRWMNMYKVSTKRIDNLENYSLEIAQRMQERDEELYQAYTEIDDLEKHILELTIALTIAIFAAVVSIITVIFVIYISIRRR